MANRPRLDLSSKKLRAGPILWQGRSYGRIPTRLEQRVLSLAEIPDTLDVETDQLATELKSWRTDQLRKLAERVAQKDARAWTGDFTDLRPDDYAIPYTKELYRAVRQTQQRVLRFGATQVRMELKRQGLETPLYLSDGTDPFWYLSLALAEGDTCDLSAASSSPAAARSMTVTSAYLLTHKLGHDWLDLILSSSLRHRRSGKQGILLEQEVLAECLPLAGAGVNAAARAEVNESFALGRALEVNQLFGQQRTETSARLSLATPELPPGRYIDYVVHSAVMDQNTCDRCAELDGTVFEYGSPEQVAAEPPYAECLGREYCRCVHIEDSWIWRIIRAIHNPTRRQNRFQYKRLRLKALSRGTFSVGKVKPTHKKCPFR